MIKGGFMRNPWIFIICIGAFFAAGLKSAQTGAGTGALRIILSGFNDDRGHAMVALCNTKENYAGRKSHYKGAVASIVKGRAEAVFSDIPYGFYAVKAFHDENDDNELNTGAFGLPSERYGFSNNARGRFGPPKFEDAGFSFNSAEMLVQITLK
jgi:uncharacterized protein (DUF2141 family)